jgi:hypothetical protein
MISFSKSISYSAPSRFRGKNIQWRHVQRSSHVSFIFLKMQQRDDHAIPRKQLLDLIEPAKADYATMLGLVDQAIIGQSKTSNAQYTHSGYSYANYQLSGSTFAHSYSGSSLKRQAKEPDIIDDSPTSKRQKFKQRMEVSGSSSKGMDRRLWAQTIVRWSTCFSP